MSLGYNFITSHIFFSMMVMVVVVMIVLVVVVHGGRSGFDCVGDCVLFSFISYLFKSSVYFKQCYNMSIDKKQKQITTQKRLMSSASMLHTVLLFKERQCGASLVPIVLGIL